MSYKRFSRGWGWEWDLYNQKITKSHVIHRSGDLAGEKLILNCRFKKKIFGIF